MTDEISDAALDQRLRSVDPLDAGALPSDAETEAVLRRLLAAGPPAARMRTRRPGRIRLLAGATAALAALAAGLVILLGSSATSPAYAVTRNRNGTITVRLIRVAGIAGANHELASMGVRARLVNLADMAAYVASLHPCQGKPTPMLRTITLNPAAIPRRQVILLPVDRRARLHYFSVVRAVDAGAALKALQDARAFAASPSRASITPPTGARILVPRASATGGTRTVRVYCASPASLPAGLVRQRVH
ncbi:MAG TPA: hypothetical protein VMF57_21255 [Solirubrobacteraceae bacterium]|nr:hypothetical protein [Solirubrobacteraceae bacterium]